MNPSKRLGISLVVESQIGTSPPELNRERQDTVHLKNVQRNIPHTQGNHIRFYPCDLRNQNLPSGNSNTGPTFSSLCLVCERTHIWIFKADLDSWGDKDKNVYGYHGCAENFVWRFFKSTVRNRTDFPKVKIDGWSSKPLNPIIYTWVLVSLTR